MKNPVPQQPMSRKLIGGRSLYAYCIAGIAVVLVFALMAASAHAATPGPGLTLDSIATPSHFSASDNARCEAETSAQSLLSCDQYEVTVTNAGARPTDGSVVNVADVVPPGLTVREVRFFSPAVRGGPNNVEIDIKGLCSTASVPVKCEYPLAIQPDETLRIYLYVTVNDPNASGVPLPNKVTVLGGGAPDVSTSSTNEIASSLPPFGVSNFDFYIGGSNGERDTQAGDHPYELTTTIDLNSAFRADSSEGRGLASSTSVQDVKDVVVDLPLGFAGSTLAAPECTLTQLSGEACPSDTVIGHLLTEPSSTVSIDSPIWNLVPERGVPAEFGYADTLHGSHVFYVRVVPTPRGYVLQATNPEIPQIELAHIVATFYGDPAEHDGTGNANVPFFTNPTGCESGPLVASIHLDSWQNPGRFNADGAPDFGDPAWASATSESPPVTGCNSLQFTPELSAQPTTSVADSPSGLDFEMRLPQTEDAGVAATPALKRAEVTLPEGMTVDPSAGDGLEACSEAQIGWEPEAEGPLKFNAAPQTCPEPSKIGTLELVTPLIPGTLHGVLYIARQNENPFGSVLAAYVVVDDPITGVLIKLAGRFTPNPVTGRMTAVFDENPQLPFSDLKLNFFGGPRAELTTPESCGTFTTSSALSPWSLEGQGLEGEEHPASPFDDFQIESGCVNGFAPAFTGGSTNLQAGAYTPFVASFSRQDTDQELGGLSVSLPPGLLADVGSVPLCPEAQANAGTCPESTQVGTVRAGAGPGPNPLFVGGKAYLTGPYNGGPYGLSVGACDRGAVQLRVGSRASVAEDRPVDRGCDGCLGPVPDDPHSDGGGRPEDRYPDPATSYRCEHRPARVHVQPNQLRQTPSRRKHHKHPGPELQVGDAVSGHKLRNIEVCPEIRGLHEW